MSYDEATSAEQIHRATNYAVRTRSKVPTCRYPRFSDGLLTMSRVAPTVQLFLHEGTFLQNGAPVQYDGEGFIGGNRFRGLYVTIHGDEHKLLKSGIGCANSVAKSSGHRDM